MERQIDLPEAPIWEESFGTIENEYHYFKSLHERSGIAVDIPQIQIYGEDAKQSNDLLRQAAFSLWEETYEDAAAYLEEWQVSEEYEATEVTYEVLAFSEDYASFVFSIMSFGGSTYHAHHCVSVNLHTKEYIRLEDIASTKQVLNAVKCGHFSVYIGTYSEFGEADAHEAEIIDLLTAKLEAFLSKETVQEGYNRFSSRNIGLDEDNLYLYVELPEIAFHDYMILCIPLNALSEEIQ